MMVLSLGEGTPGAGLDAFLAQEGITAGRRNTDAVNGLEAASAPFTAETDGGRLAGRVLFVGQGGTTYRLLGVASETRWPSHRGAVEASLRSFRTESDPAVLGARPDRLALVDLGFALTLDAFMERFPSVVPPDVVSIINQVGASGILRGESLVKRVVSGR
jgi:hypothetical protein